MVTGLYQKVKSSREFTTIVIGIIIMVKTLNMRFTLLTNFYMWNIVVFTTGTMFCSRALYLNHLTKLQLYT